MKTCSICDLEFDDLNYLTCLNCRIYRNNHANKHYKKNSEKIKQRVKDRRDNYHKKIQEYKLNIGCQMCGYKQSSVGLDFNHKSGVEKCFSISHGYKYSKEDIQKELEKVEVLCANCHRIITKDTVYKEIGTNSNEEQWMIDRKKRNRKYIDDIKRNSNCEICGISGKENPIIIDFDHIDPSKKLFGLGQAGGRSIKQIDNEITKCRTICACCHREFTSNNQVGRII